MRSFTVGSLTIGEGLPKICVPVTGTSAAEACAMAARIAGEGADLIEFRADHLSPEGDPEAILSALPALADAAAGLPILFTYRTKAQGGEGTDDAKKYRDLCAAAAESGRIGLLDVELVNECREEIMISAAKNEVPVILSDHFFDGTPMEDKMTALLLTMERRGAAVAKLAVMPEAEEDVEALIRSAAEAHRRMDIPLIAISMGAPGQRTRTECERFGGCITFARSGEGSAPGQIPVKELRERLLAEHELIKQAQRRNQEMSLPLNIDYSGKVVVITGGGGVICATMARAFAEAGAKVAALDLNEEAVKKLEEEVTAKGQCLKGYKANVLDAESLAEVHEKVLADLGPCDILINGAGGNNPRATTDNEYQHEAETIENCKTFFDLQPDGVDFVFKLNFQGTLLPTQAFAKDMVARKSGCILNISSMNAYTPLTKIPAYSGAKAAISNFTQWLATHFAGTGIRCNAIAPGFLVTNQNRTLLFNEDGTPTARTKKILDGTPAGRFVDPEELLGGTFFLCDDRSASAVTGVVLPIDAGFASYSGV